MKQYLYNVLMAIDQLGNAITGGNPDVTISGYIGYVASKSSYWRFLEKLIDFTFAPVDSPLHCYTTYLNDNDIDYSSTSTIRMIAISFIIIPSCIMLFPIIRLLGLFIRDNGEH